jgi:hypothetical protein
MFMPGIAKAVEAEVPDEADGTLFGVVTDTLPEPTATAAPVPGTEAVTAGSSDGMTGSGGIGSSIEPEGTSPVASNAAVAPLAVAFRPAAEAVTVALLGEELKLAVPPTKAYAPAIPAIRVAAITDAKGTLNCTGSASCVDRDL